MQGGQPIKLDVGQVLKDKLGARSKYIPRLLVRAVEKIIHQKDLNELLANNFPSRGAKFCEGVLADLDVQLRSVNEENLPADPRIVLVSNHPLGGLDGVTMIAWLSRHYGRTARFVVNDILMAVEPLRECFLPVNTHGAQNRESSRKLVEAMESDDPIVIYPAGLVSRLGDDGRVADTPWRKMFVHKAIEYKRTVVPVFFHANNSKFFYRMARLRKRMGLKFNYEMVLLPREIFRARKASFTLTVGKPIAWDELARMDADGMAAARIQSLVYSLSKENKSDE
ncbi:MAG: glycerol acyltransferase [Bacteroidales bacterium]|nr:glycerol acyltransferase [Bacteroidales bacterium]